MALRPSTARTESVRRPRALSRSRAVAGSGAARSARSACMRADYSRAWSRWPVVGLSSHDAASCWQTPDEPLALCVRQCFAAAPALPSHRRMRLAFVTSQLPPARPSTGAGLADACILDALRTAGCEVRHFGFLREDAPDAPPSDAVVVARWAGPGRAVSFLRKMGWLRDSARLGLPSAAARLALADSGALRKALAREGPFDGCVVSGSVVAAAFPWLFDAFPALLLAHEVGHVAARGRLADAGLIDGAMLRPRRRAAAAVRTFGDRGGALRLVPRGGGPRPVRTRHRREIRRPAAGGRSWRGDRPLRFSEDAVADIGLIGRWTCATASGGLNWFLRQIAPLLPGT